MADAVWDVLYYWYIVIMELNLQPPIVRIAFTMECARELREANLI
jgi:hypothetical protein